MRDYGHNVNKNQYAYVKGRERTLGTIDTDQLLFHLRESGYNCIQTRACNAGCGDWICIPPVGHKGYYVIREVEVNYVNSKHLVQKRPRLTYEEAEVLRYKYNEENVAC